MTTKRTAKTGRPKTRNPVAERVRIELDKSESEKLREGVKRTGWTKADVMRRALLAFIACMLVACMAQAPGQPVAELRSPVYLASDISPEHTDAVVAAVAAAGDAEPCSVSVAYDQVDPVIVAARGQAECVATVRLRRDMTASEVEQAVTAELRAMRDEADTLWIDPAIGDQRKCDATCPVDRGMVARARFRDGAECGVHVRAGDGGTWRDGCRTIVEVPASVADAEVCGYVVRELK